MSRETQLGLDFPTITYFDGQGFMVRKALTVSSVKDLNGKSICSDQGTTTELNLADYFRLNNMRYEAVSFATSDEAKKAYDARRCDAFTTDMSSLHAARLQLSNSDEHLIPPEVISKEPLSPAVRHGDNQWGDVVKLVHTAMLDAEAPRIGPARPRLAQAKSKSDAVRRATCRTVTLLPASKWTMLSREPSWFASTVSMLMPVNFSRSRKNTLSGR